MKSPILLIFLFIAEILIPQTDTKKTYPIWLINDYPLIINYYINECEVEVPENWIEAVENAFNTWQNITEEIIMFEYKGLVDISFDLRSSKEEDKGYDGFNTLTWIKDSWPKTWKDYSPDEKMFYPKGAVNWNWYKVNKAKAKKYIVESDIFFNNHNWNWKTVPSYFDSSYLALDVENICCHEVGHLLGLPDLERFEDRDCSMYEVSRIGETKKRTLEEKDILMFQELYRNHLLKFKEKKIK